MIPNQKILEVFGVSGEPVRLEGGQGTCYRVGNIVLKPTKNVIEASWLADVFDQLVCDGFRVPRPVRAGDGSWVYEGWTASEFVEGAHDEGGYKEAIEISKIFHSALVGVPKPDFFDLRDDVWAVADRIAWGESPLPDFELTNEPLRKLFSHFEKIDQTQQLVHGDWGKGNILFSKKLGPAVIDISPYWRPADFAPAVMIIDALVYEGADKSIIDYYKTTPNYKQFLFRALARRICEYIGHQNHPENTEDRSGDIKKHLDIMDIILKA